MSCRQQTESQHVLQVDFAVVAADLQSWLSTPGYPLLSASSSQGASTVTLRQQQFHPWNSSTAAGVSSSPQALWNVPMQLGQLSSSQKGSISCRLAAMKAALILEMT